MKILVAVSGSEDCADQIGAVASFPWPANTSVRVLSVAENVHPPVAGLLAGDLDVLDVQRSGDAAARNVAESAAADLHDRGLDAEGVEIEGNPHNAISDYAGTWGADLIVVGACERSAVEKFFVGSVSQSVVKHAPCSVLVVKPGAMARSLQPNLESAEGLQQQVA